MNKTSAIIHEDRIKEDILKVWDHSGFDKQVEARVLASTIKKIEEKEKVLNRGEKLSGIITGRQLQHPQVGEAFGKEGVLGAISNNVEGISIKDIATPNNVAAKKINAGLITKIVYSLVGKDSIKPLYFPVMWNPIINYFLGKLFGDKTITKEEYHKGISGQHINESTIMRFKINKNVLLEEVFKIDNQAKARTFARRGIKVTNTVPEQQYIKATSGVLVAPIAGAIIGGAIGNQIHGNDGVEKYTGIVYNPQSHDDDDEYDMTGAALGLGLGAAAGIRGVTRLIQPNVEKVVSRINKDKYILNQNDLNIINNAAILTKQYDLKNKLKI